MKKTNQLKKGTLLMMLTFLFSLNFLIAQTLEERQRITASYDLEKLDQLATKYHEDFAADKQRALELAAINEWELFIDLPNGGRAELVGVFKNGEPKYFATTNREGAITTRTDKVHTGGGAGLDLNGENMIIGIWDEGRIRETHELIVAPVDHRDEASEVSDHSTHVAGTMLGTGVVQGGAAKGMAPEAELWAYDWNNVEAEMVNAAANGLLISNHSWGIWDFTLWKYGFYDEAARIVDNIIYNAPYHLLVKSAGNLRDSNTNTGDGGYDYLTSFTNSKNNLVVAATYEVLNYTGPNSVEMSWFSSWGPTDDGRIKPDISAKGVAMFSSTGVSDNSYANYNGTSMSAPNSTGSLILLQQHYNNINENYMLASTLRGLAIHTADEAGTDPGPDYRFGWGLLNIERAAEVITDNGTSSVIIEEEIQNGEVYTFSVQSNGIDDLAVSLTWTDPPININDLLPEGPESEDNPKPMLMNDLDLRISQDGGASYYPWKLDVANFSAPATTGDNLVDNIEKADVVGATGEYIIQVSHKGRVLTNDLQAFSIIVTGIDKEEFTVSSHEGIKEACAADGSATFDLDLGFSDGFSDTIDFTVSNLPSGTSASLSPDSLNTEGTSVLTLDNIESLASGDYQIKVTAEGTSETVNVYVVLRIMDTDLPTIGLTYPEDEAIDMPIAFNLLWGVGDETVDSYDYEVARDEAFSNIEFSGNVLLPTAFIGGVTEGAEYFWRVRPNNICFEGEFSEVFSFTVEGILGAEDFVIEGLVAYPNPTTHILNVEAVSVISFVEVLNILGQTLFSKTTNTNKVQIDLSAFQTGNYFVKVTTDNSTQVMQVIKQ